MAALSLAIPLAFTPSRALAHPDLDAAIEHAEEADFDSAMARFDAAISSGQLSRDELVQLVSQRALVLQALGRDEALSRDLSLLAMLAPEHELGRAASPPLVARWNELRASQGAPASVRGSCAPGAVGTQITAQVEGLRDPELGQVFVHTRDASGEWVQKQARIVETAAGEDDLAYFIELRGPGGVTLANDGSSDAPLVCPDFSSQSSVMATAPTQEDKPRSNKRAWWWIAGTGIVAAAAAATVVIVMTRRDDNTSEQTVVSKPMVSF